MADEPSKNTTPRLPRELISLIHQAELHRSGWWDRALERIVLVTVWLQAPTTADDVFTVLTRSLEHRLDRDRINQILEQARASGTLVDAPDGRLKASEEQSKALTEELRSVSASEKRVWSRLVTLTTTAGLTPEPEALWEDFEDLFMLPLVRSAGARMYEVLTSSIDINVAVPTYHDIVEPLCDRYGTEIRAVLVAFLDPQDPDVRSYVLRTLNSAFFREAAGLGASDLAALKARSPALASLRVFVDTNFLFSFLRLHDNPSNEVADDLIDLIRRADDSVQVDLLVLPITADETRRVLRDIMFRLSGVVPHANLLTAARALSSAGLLTRYLDAAAKDTTRSLTPEAFFGPYDTDLPAILSARGVTVLDVDLAPLRIDAEVIDDLHNQQDTQKRVRRRGVKPYEANLHDMVLWHFAERARPAIGDSPLDLGVWVCTIDFGLIAFDRKKRRGTGKPPVCVSPSTLIQLLQFWVPRSDELDKALVGAIREPLLFFNFDTATEQATVRILRTLSRFDSVDDLPVATLYSILTNDALRARMLESHNPTHAEESALVEAAVVHEARRLEEALAVAESRFTELSKSSEESELRRKREATTLAGTLETRESELAALAQDLATTSQELEIVKSRSDEESRRNRENERNLEEGQSDLQRRLRDLEESAARATRQTRERRLCTAVGLGLAIALCISSIVCARLLRSRVAGGNLTSSLGAVFGGALLWLLLFEELLKRMELMRSGSLRTILLRARKGLVGLLLAVIASLIAAAIWNASRATKPPMPQPKVPTSESTIR